MMKNRRIVAVWAIVLLLGGVSLQADIIDFITTHDVRELISGDGGWGPNDDGFRLTWTIIQSPDMTWHYKYQFGKADGTELEKLTNHFIISLSDDIQETDLYNFSPDCDENEIEFGTFVSGPGNPGFPEGKSIFGVKIGLHNAQMVAEFDSNRQPMWGDFYAKDGTSSGGLWNYVYNADIGVTVANPHDYMGTPVDASGAELCKVLVPNNIPEPITICLLGLGGLALLRKRKA